MPEIEPLVSVIIPVFNGERYLSETIDTVKKQTYGNWEILLINDGSTDNTSGIIQQTISERIRTIVQKNSGVSVARNNGLKNAKGEFVMFLDADDLLTPHFLELRVKMLQSDSYLGFTGGLVDTFPDATVTKRPVANDPPREILFFDANCVTIPSNYLFRKELLVEHEITFNPNLTSTADRFFILQVSKVSAGKAIIDPNGKLLYRVSPTSMSHFIKPSLIKDNEMFYKELVRFKLLPTKDLDEFKGLYFYSLAIGYFKVRFFGHFFKYLIKSILMNPGGFLTTFRKKILGNFSR